MKISALKNLISLPNNEAILAGLYTYVVEEFGKIILLSKCPSVKNRREITYNRLKYPDTARPCKRHIVTYSPYVISSEQKEHLTKLKSSANSAAFLQSGHIIFTHYLPQMLY